MFAKVPSEISFDWVYFAPFFFTVAIGYLAAMGTAKILKSTGAMRHFWHPGLVFLATWLLFTSLLGLTFIPP